MERRAAFLDRDGTLIRDVHFLREPADVALLPGIVEALSRLLDAGFLLIVITNQSGIARGLLTEADYQRVHQRLIALLAAEDVYLSGEYHCPHHADFPLDGITECACRKPGTLLYERASEDLDLDPSRAVFIGDRWRDIAPARHFGGRGILVPSPDTPSNELALARAGAEVVPDLGAAAALVALPTAD